MLIREKNVQPVTEQGKYALNEEKHCTLCMKFTPLKVIVSVLLAAD